MPAPGERWSAPNLAKTLRAVAKGGADAFYRGEIAEKLLAFLKQEGALFSADDFAQQQAVMYAPIATDYRGAHRVRDRPAFAGLSRCSSSSTSSKASISASLSPLSAERMHLLIEAKKLAFADRNRYAGDPAFVTLAARDAHLESSTPRSAAREIDPQRARSPDGALVAEHSGDTSYFAVADGDGNAISFIHSLSNAFGSCVVAGETGITLNNRAGRGFSLDPEHPNVHRAGPAHDAHAERLHGLPRRRAVARRRHAGRRPADAVEHADDHQRDRSRHVAAGRDRCAALPQLPGNRSRRISGAPPVVKVEERVPQATREQLARLGHTVQTVGPWGGGGAVQLIQLDRERGVLRGATDPRPGGLALGF